MLDQTGIKTGLLVTKKIFRTIRLVRMLRILKLSRYSRGFRILGLTLVRSTRVLFLLVCFQVRSPFVTENKTVLLG